jgi:hypothetical protein
MSANYIAKWDGSSWSALGSGMNNYVYALAPSASDLYAGGSFATAGGKVSAYVARAVLGDAPGYNHLTGTPMSGGDTAHPLRAVKQTFERDYRASPS